MARSSIGHAPRPTSTRVVYHGSIAATRSRTSCCEICGLLREGDMSKET